jgi:SAM-dependent methyltransferase
MVAISLACEADAMGEKGSEDQMKDASQRDVQLPWTGERVVPGIPETEALFQFHWTRYSFAVANMHGGRVLDMGCGAGYGAYLLATSDPASFIIGMDIAQDAIAFAKSRYQATNLRYIVGDALAFPFAWASFDMIVALEVIEHLKDAQQAVEKVRRLLKPDGVFVVSTPNRDVYSEGHKEPWNPYHIQEFSLPEFKALLSSFPYIQIYGQSHAVGSLIWDDDVLNNISVRLDLIGNKPLSEAEFLIAVCSLEKRPLQPSRLWLMEVQDLCTVLEKRQRYLEQIQVQIASLNKSVGELMAYQRRVEGLWPVRVFRHLHKIYASLVKSQSSHR